MGIEEYVMAIFKHLDKDASARLSFDEFVLLYKEVIRQQPAAIQKANSGRRITVEDARLAEASLRSFFDHFDVDGSGFLDMSELQEVLLATGLPDVNGDNFQSVLDEHMALADADMDGQIDFQEFVVYCNAVVDALYVWERARQKKETRVY